MIFAFIVKAKRELANLVDVAKFVAQIMLNESSLEVTKFIAQKSSKVHNDSVLEVSVNTLISKPLMASKIAKYVFFVFT